MKNTKWNNTETNDLFKAILALKTLDEAANFCRDLMTEDEIIEFGKRFKMAQLLNAGKSQRTIAKAMNVSITTVTRVNKWLKSGMGGYKAVLEKLALESDSKVDIEKVSKVSHHHKAKFAVL